MMEYDEGLTPVEEYDGIFYKRDDLYAPYGENFVTGGKIRQCRDLIKQILIILKKNVVVLFLLQVLYIPHKQLSYLKLQKSLD